MHNRGPFIRGTTIPGMEIETPTLNLTSVCCQLRDKYDRLVYQYQGLHTDHVITLEDIGPGVSSSFPVGTLYYDVKVTTQEGQTSVLLHGSTIEIEADNSRC